MNVFSRFNFDEKEKKNTLPVFFFLWECLISTLCSGVACGDFALLCPNDNLAVIGIPLDSHNGETRIKRGGWGVQ